MPAAVNKAAAIGRLPSTTSLNLALGLPLRDQAALTGLLKEIYDPASPSYRHYFTPEQFDERFGPTEADYHAVIGFAKAHNLAVTGTHPNHILSAMATNTAIKQFGCSWDFGSLTSTDRGTMDNYFQKMAADGQSFSNATAPHP